MASDTFDSSARPAPAPFLRNEAQLQSWLDGFEQKLEALSVTYNAASYARYVGQATANLNDYDEALAKMFAEPSYQLTVREWQPKVSDTLLKRRLVVLQRSFLEAEVSKSPAIFRLRNAINERLLAYQPTIRGEAVSRSDLTEILRSHPDRHRRRAAFEEAQRPLAEELAPQVRELMRRRNAEAHHLGYTSYPDLHLELLGLSRAQVYRLFDELEELTARPYQTFLEESRRQVGLIKLEQWDLSYLADQKANLPAALFPREQILPRLFDFLRKFGLEPEKLPIQVQIQDIPFGGLCYSIHIPSDIRILCYPKDGYPYYRTMFHEFGHGLHSAFNRQTHYILKREPGIFNEAMAETLAYFSQQPEWLSSVSGLPLAEIERFQQANLGRRLLRFRTLMAQARFEIEAYSNLETDLDKLYSDYETRYLLIEASPVPRWAASSFPTTHPIYRQNYVIAEMIAAQTHATLRQQHPIDWAARFAFLCDNYYGPGALLDWPEKLRRATGQNLSVAALAADLS